MGVTGGYVGRHSERYTQKTEFVYQKSEIVYGVDMYKRSGICYYKYRT